MTKLITTDKFILSPNFLLLLRDTKMFFGAMSQLSIFKKKLKVSTHYVKILCDTGQDWGIIQWNEKFYS